MVILDYQQIDFVVGLIQMLLLQLITRETILQLPRGFCFSRVFILHSPHCDEAGAFFAYIVPPDLQPDDIFRPGCLPANFAQGTCHL